MSEIHVGIYGHVGSVICSSSSLADEFLLLAMKGLKEQTCFLRVSEPDD